MSRGTAGSLLARSALAALLLFPAPSLRAQEEAAADTAAAPDTVEAVGDTVGAPGDTAAAADTTGGRDLERVKRGLAGGGFPQRDSLFRALVEMPGFRVLEYRGRDVEMLVDRRVIVLRDSAQANYGDAALLADSITYRARERFVTARGDLLLVSPGRREMTSDSVLYYDVSRRKGTVFGARTEFAERGSTWQVRGDAVPLGRDTVFVEAGSFSSCQLEVPHYLFQAGEIKMVSQNVIVAWPVVLYISEVPVFWLPFFAQDIRPGRRSGIIPPQFGFNDVVRTSGSLNRHIQDFGYYWAINRFMDAKATMDWFSGQWTRLNGEFRYNFRKSFIRGNVSGSREWGATGDNFTVRFNHDQELTPDTRLRADGTYVENTRLRTDRSFDPESQTQTIDSNVGLSHDFGWGRVDVSGRRRQFLEEAEQVDLTLPDVRLNLSPVTLFEAPPGRGGPFSNLTWSGNATYSRKSQSREQSTDRLTTNASLNNSLRLGELSLSSGATVSDARTTPVRTVVDSASGPDSARVDTSFVELASSDRTTVDWRAAADYQLDLMGSTTLSPTVEVRKSWFRSSVPGDSVLDTGGSFLGGPTRTSVGANLRSDLYGFFPGFGPFSSIRHKISPRFSWRYQPSVSVPAGRDSIPGFPGGSGRAVNRLTVGLSQTLEAKLEEAATREDTATSGRDTAGVAADTAGAAAPGDTAGAAAGEAAGAGPGRRPGPGGAAGARKVTLLSLRSDPLTFDFEARKRGEPVLTTDRWGHSLSSDLLQGLSMNFQFDLFEGLGEDRTFDPFLSSVSAGFSLSSGASLGDIIGLGRGGGPPSPPEPARPGLGGLDQASQGLDEDGRDREEERGAGPWNLNLHYSLSRAREGATFGRSGDNQSLSGSLNFNPTPNWRVTWSTQYSFTRSEFGYHQVTLIRELHRWTARFNFQKATNGNFLFQMLVRLEDAPELKVDYNQRSEPVRR